VRKKVKAAASWDMKEKLFEDLQNPSYVAAYVNEARLEGDEFVFKTALADVIRARCSLHTHVTDKDRNLFECVFPNDAVALSVRTLQRVSGTLIDLRANSRIVRTLAEPT